MSDMRRRPCAVARRRRWFGSVPQGGTPQARSHVIRRRAKSPGWAPTRYALYSGGLQRGGSSNPLGILRQAPKGASRKTQEARGSASRKLICAPASATYEPRRAHEGPTVGESRAIQATRHVPDEAVAKARRVRALPEPPRASQKASTTPTELPNSKQRVRATRTTGYGTRIHKREQS